VLLALHQLGYEGLVTCDENMLWLPETVAVVEQTGLSVVVCAGAGHDPIMASGLLLAHLPHVAKRHRKGSPQIWTLKAVDRGPIPLAKHKESLARRSGVQVDDFRLSDAQLRTPVLPG
jgi:hypothetical protein